MKVAFFGNGPLACRVLDFMIASDETIVLLAIHPAEKSRDDSASLLVASATKCNAKVILGNELRNPESVARIAASEAEIGVSIMFGYILREDVLQTMPRGCVNLHPSYLPYNRGAHPNVWPIIDGTPAGVTLHRIDSGVDTGPILSQRRVDVLPEDTALSLYDKLMSEAYELFISSWADVKAGNLTPIPQDPTAGTSHKVADLALLDEISLDGSLDSVALINQIRARTFPPYPGAYFMQDGKKVFVRLELTREE